MSRSRWRAETLKSPVDGEEIPVFTRGDGDEALLLLHGWTLDHRAFEPQAPLADDYRLLAPDRRSFGTSRAAPDLAAELDDIDAIIDALAPPSLHLLGVSQGARLALRYAATRPRRLHSLIVQGAVVDGFDAPVANDEPIPLAHYADLVRRGDMAAMRREWLAHPLMSSDPLDAAQQAAVHHMVSDYRGADLCSPAMADTPPAVLEALAGSTLPTLIISGELETAGRRAHASKLCSLMPGAREIVLGSCGHLSNLSQAAAYNAALRHFLGGLTPRR
jgi:pimeloyl-ACP methyl ester carboxylesterase